MSSNMLYKLCVPSNISIMGFASISNAIMTISNVGVTAVFHTRVLTWWRHLMETFSAILILCAGNSPNTGEFPSQKPAPLSFDVFCHLRLNKQFSKQRRRRWWETFDTYHTSICKCRNIQKGYLKPYTTTPIGNSLHVINITSIYDVWY